jgi:hypothetical protein
VRRRTGGVLTSSAVEIPEVPSRSGRRCSRRADLRLRGVYRGCIGGVVFARPGAAGGDGSVAPVLEVLADVGMPVVISLGWIALADVCAVLVTAAPAGVIDRPAASSRPAATVRVALMTVRFGRPRRHRDGRGPSGVRNETIPFVVSLTPGEVFVGRSSDFGRISNCGSFPRRYRESWVRECRGVMTGDITAGDPNPAPS